jgi:hypothetical protein
LAAAVSFTAAGIQARNGSAYAADTAMAWNSGSPYHLRMVVSVPAHTYSVYVTPNGGTEQLLAGNYSFRTEQSSATALNYIGVLNEVGVDAVCAPSLNGILLDSMLMVITTTSNGATGTVLVDQKTGGLVLPSAVTSPAANQRTRH